MIAQRLAAALLPAALVLAAPAGAAEDFTPPQSATDMAGIERGLGLANDHRRAAWAAAEAADWDRAVAEMQQSVAILRAMNATTYDAVDPYVYDALFALGEIQAQAGRTDAAVATWEKAATLAHGLLADAPAEEADGLATADLKLLAVHARAGAWAEGAAAAERAIRHYRAGMAADPDRYRQGLAMVLGEQARALIALEQPAEALPLLDESTDLLRQAAAEGADVRRPLAFGLLLTAQARRQADDPAGARAAAEAALTAAEGLPDLTHAARRLLAE